MNNFYDGGNYDTKKRAPKARSYMAVILTTSIISSVVTGGILNYKFTETLNAEVAQLQQSVQTSAAQKLDNSTSDTASNNTVVTKTSAVLEKGSSTVSSIAKKAGPSIVGIRLTVGGIQNYYSRNNNQPSSSEGSGVIISKDGYIMTNYHVVEYADPVNNVSTSSTLEVFLPDGRETKAEFIGGDSKNDLAVIKINLDNLTVAELGDSSALEVGDLAVAIGNPLGMEFAGSVTTGVISALNREVTVEDTTLNLIQTDAAINPGNSGGALVNSQGQVIGINTVKISVSGVEGLGFAIPMNDAKPIVDQLIQYGYVKGRPLIGISGREITSVLSQQYDLPEGIYITEVSNGSGAYEAGIQPGDVLVILAGKEVKTMSDVDDVKKSYKAGDTVDAVIFRDNNKITLKLTFSEER
jgi:serine protease Do